MPRSGEAGPRLETTCHQNDHEPRDSSLATVGTAVPVEPPDAPHPLDLERLPRRHGACTRLEGQGGVNGEGRLSFPTPWMSPMHSTPQCREVVTAVSARRIDGALR